MGSSRLADALTGLSIPRGEPVVALVVVRRTGGYPDATTHAANAPLSPSEAFEPVSLPIRARAGDYGDVEPEDGDPAAALLLDLANKPDWASLAEEGFGYKAAVKLGEAAREGPRSRFFGPEDEEPYVLGIVAFGQSSWDRIVALGAHHLSREDDVRVVLGAFAKVRAAAASGDNRTFAMNMDLAGLAGSYLYEPDPDSPKGVRDTRMPELARALARREGGSLVSGVATGWMRRSGVLGTRLVEGEAGPGLVGLLGAVWDLQAAERGMDVLSRTWQPSYGAGQYDNAREIAEEAAATFGEAAGRLLADMEEGMADEETAVPQMEALLARLDEVRAALAERLDAAREHYPEP